jgi:hypothetical protein
MGLIFLAALVALVALGTLIVWALDDGNDS